MANPVLAAGGAERLREPFAALAAALRDRIGGRRVIFMRTDGNYGDAVIHHGTRAFLDDAGIGYRLLDMASRADKVRALIAGATSRTAFLYSGGGGWARACDVALVNVRRQLKATRRLTVLPSTIELTIPNQPPTYVRDRFESRRLLPDAPFCHDMAFYLALVAPDRLLADRVAPSRPIGLVFRTDNEARISGIAAHPANADISAWGTAGDDTGRFLRHLDQYEHVVTDRLHAAIGAALLGKQVSLVRGSYFKIEAIFRSSIEGVFPRCRLIDDDEARVLAAAA